MSGYSITTLRAPFFRWHAVITLKGGPVVTMDPTFGRRRAQELAKRYGDGFVEFRVNVELGPKASSSDDVRDALRKAIGVTSDGGPIYSPEPVLRGENLHPHPLGPAMEEIIANRSEIERLRTLITAWADACDHADRAGATQVDEIAWEQIAALRKAVGR